VGWWLGEILLLMGLLGGPAILGYLFLEAYLQAQYSGTQAKVFSDVLAHDISNLHQAILYALELARMKITPDHLREKALDEAFIALADADRLAKNVRTLGQIEVFEFEEFQKMNLISSIHSAFNLLTQVIRSEYLSLNFINQELECLILANPLLDHIFLNLFHNAFSYSEKKQIDVEVSSITTELTKSWKVKIVDYGPGIPPQQRESLFERYMKGSKGSGLGLSVVKALTELFRGTIRIENRVKGDYSQGSAFVLTFPAYESKNTQ
jgi:signal transduction histidine kinase